MSKTTDRQASEREFQKLVRRLLQVENSVLQHTQQAFTQERLHKVLNKFCEIIADFIKAESCTVQLTLYDPSDTRVKGTFPADEMARILDERCEESEPQENSPSMDREQRTKNYQSIQTFPYWWSGKGAMQLVATNQGSVATGQALPTRSGPSPWHDVLKDRRKHEYAFLRLTMGVTTIIVQDKLPRVRDRWQIREMRHWQKLGRADMVIWDNSDWRRIFRNYYGVPIQIHANGETVGLLKLENKNWAKEEGQEEQPNPIENLFSAKVSETKLGNQRLLNRFVRAFPETAAASSQTPGSDEVSDQPYEPFSFLARAYLLMEIRSLLANRYTGKLFDKYPEDPSQALRPPKTMRVPKVGRAPVQIFALETGEEDKLLKLVASDDAIEAKLNIISDGFECLGNSHLGVKLRLKRKLLLEGKPKLAKSLKLLLALDEFRATKEASGGSKKYTEAIAKALEKALKKVLGESGSTKDTIEVKPWSLERTHFAYQITLTLDTDNAPEGMANLKLICVVPPTWSELRGLVGSREEKTRKCAPFYQRFIETEKYEEPEINERNGEFATILGGNGEVRVRDLWIDRMAARVQALVFAVPVPAFTDEDTRLLTWAAFEIGKLIERRIAYHANRGRDPLPLTSIEFFRLPISGVCFVDDLKQRRIHAERVKNHLDHYLWNLVFDTHFNDHQEYVRYRSRIKGSGNYLTRLGERWAGYVNGSMAVYFYLLAKSLKDLGDPEEVFKSLTEKEKKKAKGFLDALETLAAACEKSVDRQDDVAFGELTKEDRVILNDNELGSAMGSWVGDVNFLSPPLPTTFDNVEEARDILKQNLEREGIRDLTKNGELKTSSFQNLLFRNYDAFLGNSASLLCQVLQWPKDSAGGKPEMNFRNFYRAAYRLKELLSKSSREMEEDDLRPLQEFWNQQLGNGGGGDSQADEDTNGEPETNWNTLLDYVASYETVDFMKHFGQDGWDKEDADNTPKYLLPLTPTGIYKRIRMLWDTLRRQRASAHLEWLTRRFDFLGCRLTCLYKNQVFALYEQIWNQGDPFFVYNYEAVNDFAEFCPAASSRTPEASEAEQQYECGPAVDRRHRWLCLRTNVHEGEYRALQIAALADPEAIRPEHWHRSHYNLRRLKHVLGVLLGTYERKEEPKKRAQQAEQYASYAFHRNRFRAEYLRWFRAADALTRPDEDAHVVQVSQGTNPNGPDFGDFLCEAVFDFVLMESDADQKDSDIGQKDAARAIIAKLSSPLRNFLEAASGYTSGLLKTMATPTVDWCPKKDLREAAKRLYDAAIDACEERANKSGNETLSAAKLEYYESEKVYLESEKERLWDKAAEWSWPAVWVPSHRYETWSDYFTGSADSPELSDAEIQRFVQLWETIRREQKEFLFYARKKPDEPMGLRCRERESVLDRIMNYVLLFDPVKFPDNQFEGWTAYDLFYYVRSLIPVEIQIRTAFTDTMAEQYHDAIYKGRPKKGTEAPRKRLAQLSRRLAELDNEMEIDFEDYADRQMEAERRQNDVNETDGD